MRSGAPLRGNRVGRLLLALVAATAANLLIWTAPTAGAAGEPASVPPVAPVAFIGEGCMECHGRADLSMTLPNGESLSLYVDEAAMAGSVHAGKLLCADCHSRTGGYPHRKIQVADRRGYSIAQYEACKRCHFTNYTRTLDSIHYQRLETGDPRAPLCIDCHGSHLVTPPDRPRSKVSEGCGKCHLEVSEAYRTSVHGAALEGEENPDVPVCTDCHGTHLIKDATTAAFRLDSPEMCAKCHADPGLTARYGLSPNVFKTYVSDFHGATVELTKRHDPNDWTDKAVCSDCHGVHDIKSAKNESAADLKKNIVSRCQRCHPEAGANFPDAWLSHYELSPGKDLLPWAVRTAYALFIPIMVSGLVLHLIVDLWRIARNR